jgi:hypothetical protein
MRMSLFSAIAGCVLFAMPASAAEIKVSLLTGKAEVQVGGDAKKTAALSIGKTVAQGDVIETKDASKLELALPDGSKLRLGAKTKVTLTEAHFGANKERNVSVSTWIGRVWAKVAKSVGGSDTFEVETRNAVAGVRGTSFGVHAAADLSAVVRVYAGTVGVRKGEGGAFASSKTRKQIPGPSQIDKKQWEEIIASAMKQVKITAAGEISPAEDFADTGEDLEWAMWNQTRDKEAERVR